MAATIRRGLPRAAGGDPWPPADPPIAASSAASAPAVESAPAAAPMTSTATPDPAPAAAPETTTAAPAAQPPAAPAREVSLRRGLPRTPGGDAWPPAGTATLAVGGDAAAEPALESSVAAPPAADPAVATPAAGAALRRGLPRTPAGDPWPPAGTAAGSSSTPAPEVPAAAAAPAVTTATATTATAAPAPAVTTAPAAGESVSVRRGLPRAVGGDPWPPDGFVAVRAVTPAPGAQIADPAVAPAAEPAPAEAAAVEAASVAPVVRGPRSTLSPVAQSVRERAGKPGSPDEPDVRPWYKPHWPLAIAGLMGLAGLLMLAIIGVLTVRGLLSTPAMQDFLVRYPGEYHLPETTDEGFPAWARWNHFLNMFFIVLIIRSGMQVRHQKKPPAYWASKRGSKISINLWLHQSLDILWIVNGIVFIVLLFATGHWARIVPTSWDVFPNALSAALQYVSLDWPTENGWINYNSLQQLAYFSVVFLAAPLAIVTGVRMSGIWPKNAKALSKAYPIELARAIHFPTMLFFVAFVIFHVGLVFATGALRNLNHMYAGQDVVNWAGFGVFALSMIAVVAAWFAARPLVLAPIAGLFGRVSER